VAELSASPDPELSPAAPTPTSAPAPIGRGRYVVQPGDTVLSIAERQGLHPATLASVNDLVDPDLLQPGEELVVPATDGLVHVVQPGETLRAIAERYDVDIEAIVSANDLASPDQIAVGLRLLVPGASPQSVPPG
jgi:N-acetylmuramoyl-L-alanine amidase